jgi:hypothetical protein
MACSGKCSHNRSVNSWLVATHGATTKDKKKGINSWLVAPDGATAEDKKKEKYCFCRL